MGGEEWGGGGGAAGGGGGEERQEGQVLKATLQGFTVRGAGFAQERASNGTHPSTQRREPGLVTHPVPDPHASVRRGRRDTTIWPGKEVAPSPQA